MGRPRFSRYFSQRKIRIRAFTLCTILVLIALMLLVLVSYRHQRSLLAWYKCHFHSENCEALDADGPDVMTMGVKPQIYEKMNTFQEENAVETIDEIKENGINNGGVKLIVDVGCGTGDVTKMFANLFPTSKILAFDIDPEMIRFIKNQKQKTHHTKHHANKKSKKSKSKTLAKKTIDDDTWKKNTSFFTQDISKAWKYLNKKLRKVEGQADLIWSNFALHWIPTELRLRAIKNMLRLLRPGGHFYLNILLGKDLIEFLQPEDKPMFIRVLKIPGFNRQGDEWLHYLNNTGHGIPFSAVEARLLSTKFVLKKEEEEVPFTRDYLRMYRPFLEPSLSRGAKDYILEDLHSALEKTYLSTRDEDGVASVTYDVFKIHGIKYAL